MAESIKFPVTLDTSNTDKYLINGHNVRGTYHVVNNITERNALPIDSGNGGVIITGSLCYCIGDSKFYQYNGSTWVEAQFGSDEYVKKSGDTMTGRLKLRSTEWYHIHVPAHTTVTIGANDSERIFFTECKNVVTQNTDIGSLSGSWFGYIGRNIMGSNYFRFSDDLVALNNEGYDLQNAPYDFDADVRITATSTIPAGIARFMTSLEKNYLIEDDVDFSNLVKKSGDTMTGSLNFDGEYLSAGSIGPFQDYSGQLSIQGTEKLRLTTSNYPFTYIDLYSGIKLDTSSHSITLPLYSGAIEVTNNSSGGDITLTSGPYGDINLNTYSTPTENYQRVLYNGKEIATKEWVLSNTLTYEEI